MPEVNKRILMYYIRNYAHGSNKARGAEVFKSRFSRAPPKAFADPTTATPHTKHVAELKLACLGKLGYLDLRAEYVRGWTDLG